MIIGVDLDDTINNLAEQFLFYAKKYNEENKIDYKIIEDEWDFDKAYGWSIEDEKRFLKKYIKVLIENATIKEEASEIIKRLREEGNKVFIITARSAQSHKDMFAITEKWLKQNNVVARC